METSAQCPVQYLRYCSTGATVGPPRGVHRRTTNNRRPLLSAYSLLRALLELRCRDMLESLRLVAWLGHLGRVQSVSCELALDCCQSCGIVIVKPAVHTVEHLSERTETTTLLGLYSVEATQWLGRSLISAETAFTRSLLRGAVRWRHLRIPYEALSISGLPHVVSVSFFLFHRLFPVMFPFFCFCFFGAPSRRFLVVLLFCLLSSFFSLFSSSFHSFLHAFSPHTVSSSPDVFIVFNLLLHV